MKVLKLRMRKARLLADYDDKQWLIGSFNYQAHSSGQPLIATQDHDKAGSTHRSYLYTVQLQPWPTRDQQLSNR